MFDPALSREEAGNVLLRLRVAACQVVAFPLAALLQVFAMFFCHQVRLFAFHDDAIVLVFSSMFSFALTLYFPFVAVEGPK